MELNEEQIVLLQEVFELAREELQSQIQENKNGADYPDPEGTEERIDKLEKQLNEILGVDTVT